MLKIKGSVDLAELEKLGFRLFKFIKWEDEEPYNIQELLEKY